MRYASRARLLLCGAVVVAAALIVAELVGGTPAVGQPTKVPAASAPRTLRKTTKTPPRSTMVTSAPAVAPSVDKTSPALFIALPSSPSAGARAFETFQCARCHAVGQGPEKVGPNLGRLGLRLSFLEGATRLWNHIPGMSRRMKALRLRWPQPTATDLVNIVAFITAYQYYLTRVGRPGRPGRGERLFRKKRCAGCHSLVASKRLVGPSLYRYGRGRSVLDLAQAMWNHGPAMQRMLETKLVPRPFFRAREMANLLSFLATQGVPRRSTTAYVEPGSPTRGAKVFVQRGCSRCHAVRGRGGGLKPGPGEKVPPDIGRLGSATVRDYTDIVALMWNHGVPMWGRMKRAGIGLQPLRNTELADLVSLLFFVNFADRPGDVRRGREVFEKTGCESCHTISSSGGDRIALPAKIVGKSAQAIIAAMWRAAPRKLKRARKLGINWPQIKPGRMPDLIAYLKSIARKKRTR